MHKKFEGGTSTSCQSVRPVSAQPPIKYDFFQECEKVAAFGHSPAVFVFQTPAASQNDVIEENGGKNDDVTTSGVPAPSVISAAQFENLAAKVTLLTNRLTMLEHQVSPDQPDKR